MCQSRSRAVCLKCFWCTWGTMVHGVEVEVILL